MRVLWESDLFIAEGFICDETGATEHLAAFGLMQANFATSR